MEHESAALAEYYPQDDSRNLEGDSDEERSTPEHSNSQQTNCAQSNGSAARRIACVICRRRKLKCDGARPSCHTCSRLGHKCGYDDIRRKSGPKRGYVKELEARLKALESQLKSEQATAQTHSSRYAGDLGAGKTTDGRTAMSYANTGAGSVFSSGMEFPNLVVTSETNGASSPDFPWEMIGLGLEEPLPPADMIDELHQVYFEKLHYTMPLIHKYRYLAAMNLAPHMRPAICLRYSIWALACSVIEKYFNYSDIFYQRARKYAENDEMKGHGESFITVGHCQSWILISLFEFKMLYFPRAWMSTGRATRLATMLSLHRQDGPSLEVKQTLPPPRDWTDREERRRTFWMAYCTDRYASIGTGWPMSLDELDISTNLPASNESFEKSRSEQTLTLPEAMTADGAAKLSSFAGVVVMACLCGKNLTHLHRASDSDTPEDPAGEFWKRHHKLDSILMTTSMFLPDHLRMQGIVQDPNVVTLNMYIHSATICLHQAAILKAEKHGITSNIIRESTDRCFMAASEICSLMKLVTPTEVAYMNPFMAFCLYVAARVFSHSYAKRPNDESIRNSLFFLLSAMQAHRSKNNLTESFLVQIQVELDAAGLEHPLHNRSTYRGTKSSRELFEEGRTCPPVFPTPSATQPTFHEIHAQRNDNLMPPRQPSPTHSPQPTYKSSFAVPTRERRAAPYHSGPSTGWADQTSPEPYSNRFSGGVGRSPESSGDAIVSTPANSQRTSSNTSYSPHPHEESSIKLPQVSTVPATSPFFPTVSNEYTTLQNGAPGVQAASDYSGQLPNDAGMGINVHANWMLDPVVEIDHAAWGMDGMAWDSSAHM